MKKIALLLTLMVGATLPACAEPNDHNEMVMPTKVSHRHHQEHAIKVELRSDKPLVAGETSHVTVRLSYAKDGKPITPDDLNIVHTEKLHLLIIDPSLSDYQHIHPDAGNIPGEYTFDFTPLKNARYRVWANFIPTRTGQEVYESADIGMPAKDKTVIDKTVSTHTIIDGYDFTLTLDEPLKAGEADMASMTVTKDGKPFAQLQPVLGAFAHVVGFSENFKSVVHVHPLGDEPTTDDARGGPKLELHIEPKFKGFYKIFAQVRIDNKIIFVPFGVKVQ